MLRQYQYIDLGCSQGDLRFSKGLLGKCDVVVKDSKSHAMPA
jgi:hypothetical protein